MAMSPSGYILRDRQLKSSKCRWPGTIRQAQVDGGYHVAHMPCRPPGSRARPPRGVARSLRF